MADSDRIKNELTAELLAIAGRHRAHHDIHHTARDLAGWSRRHVGKLREPARDRGITLDHRPGEAAPVRSAVRHRGAGQGEVC